MEYNERIKQIKSHITQYSFKDALKSIYAINAWLPNISSQVKIFLFNQLLLNIPINSYNANKEIKEYSEFTSFAEVLIDLAPSFPISEDYIPETDFGEVKYYFDRAFYKVFYGGGFTAMYEFYQLFEAIHLPLNDLFTQLLNKNPRKDFKNLLTFLNYTIKNTNPKLGDTEFEVGNIEVPSFDFWTKCLKFINSFNTNQILDEEFINKFSIDLKTINESVDLDNKDLLFEKCNSGLVTFFIKNNNDIYPLFTREYIVSLFESYTNEIENLSKKIDFITIKRQIDIGIIKFIKDRFNEKSFEILMQSVDIKKKVNGEIIYTFVFQTEEKQYLFYVHDEFEQNLNLINQKLTNDKIVIENNDNAFYNYYKQQGLKLNSPKPIVQYLIILQYSTESQIYELPRNQNFSIILLRDFFYIFDEIENFEEFSKYEEFKTSNLIAFAVDEIDKFAAFKESNSILIEGAIEPTLISVNPHWGDSYRYNSLKKFWDLYPEKSNYRHPRGWNVKRKYDRIIEMYNIQDKDLINYIKINKSHILCSSTINSQTKEQFSITSLLSDCLTYNLQKFYKQIAKINLFSQEVEILIKVFPSSIIKQSNFKHLSYLFPFDGLWTMNMIKSRNDFYGVHFIYNEELVNQCFTKTINRKYENKMLIDFLSSIDQISEINQFDEIKEIINKTLSDKPGHTLNKIQLNYSYSEGTELILPEIKDFKIARKKIAHIVKEQGIKEGTYSSKEGLKIIDKIRAIITCEIENEVKKISFSSLPFLINQVDELSHRNNLTNKMLHKTKDHEITYDNKQRLSEEKKTFYKNRKNMHYLIEMLVSSPEYGTQSLNTELYKYLLAMINWLYVLLDSSDALYYDLNSKCEIEITHQFLVNINYEEETMHNISKYVDYRSRQSINENLFFSPYNNQEEIDTLMNKLDKVFLEQCNFNYRNIFILLDCLANWNSPNSSNVMQEAKKEEILKYLSNEINPDEATKIIDFLTLDSSLIKCLVTQDKVIEKGFIPVLEHNKRHHKYTIRPLIKNKMNNTYIWGLVSMYKSHSVWFRHLTNGQLPYISQNSKINLLIKSQEKFIQKKIVTISYNKLKEYFNENTVYKERELFKLDKKGNHPRDLGDFDLLVLSEKHNLVLNIECKYIKPSYSMKDSKSDMEKIFYNDGKKKNYISKLAKRQHYLKQNITKVYRNLNLNFNDSEEIKVVPIFLTMSHLYWTKFPPIKTDIVFLCINELEEYLKSLIMDS